MSLQNFLADDQLSKQQLLDLIALAIRIKAKPQDYQNVLAGKSVAMIFEKPSLRTHVSFDIGINKLGGHALYLGQQNGKLGERERVSDYAKNLSCWADVIVARVFSHNSIQQLAEHASVPVVNALCDSYHPCQGLADFVTLAENFDDLSAVKFAYVGDGNNVSNSLMIMAATLGMDFTLCCPPGHGPSAEMFNKALKIAEQSGAKLILTSDVSDLGQQDAIYTDTWVSMGDDTKVEDILAKFMPYQVNHQMMTDTGAKIVMHCQPAHLEEEITTELFDSELAVVFQQAENRMWAQNAVLVSFFQ
ncbi:ornithine carbamoyltransferase [Endozoicomonas sp. G2_1]|uniref:ornithine carbamoyltransferase n=1 Tax=Endozoicomonas sp. G2_1 TaxID=2821091 RepID=UPI001ADB4BE4|nr:ornithine carbamoyltransferase [Endozoicomonas sp. G2_1]MBO9491568.1 ornithine carbamoyltransferase [Endozoicomonas sp. G2_1]